MKVPLKEPTWRTTKMLGLLERRARRPVVPEDHASEPESILTPPRQEGSLENGSRGDHGAPRVGKRQDGCVRLDTTTDSDAVRKRSESLHDEVAKLAIAAPSCLYSARLPLGLHPEKI